MAADPSLGSPRLRRIPARRLVVGLWIAWIVALLPTGAAAETRRRAITTGQDAVLVDSKHLYLSAAPLQGEGLWAFTRRLTGGQSAATEISELNGRPRRLVSGSSYRVPYEHLRPELQVAVLTAFFPGPQRRADVWIVEVPAGFEAVSLWDLALWLTGDGKNFLKIRFESGTRDHDLRAGEKLSVPRNALKPAFRALLPADGGTEPTPDEADEDPDVAEADGEEPGAAPTPPPTVSGPQRGPDPRLTYHSDASGSYAVYRLKRGEALYSAVVVRFIGAVRAQEVNEIAGELIKLNGIRDVTDMPVGQPVRIPFDLLLPEFLPADDPRRVEYESDRAASAQYSNTVRASRLEGITIILDAGHGGDDPGTNHHGTWESVYVYDVMLRIKKLLESRTAATVIPTTRDEAHGFEITERDKLPVSRRHQVLTKPPYSIRDTKVSTHLRWYLANSQHRKAARKSGDTGKTVFLSIHADSLHQSLRGAMVYVPSTSLTKGSFGKTGSLYSHREEYREKPKVSYSWKERTRSEGLSRQLADDILRSFRRHSLAVHKEKPVRDRIIRCRGCRPFVPAVVRFNEVPTKLLLEICNMNNAEDRALLTTTAFRQKVAEAVVDGILDYYGQPVLDTAPKRAR